MVKDITLTIRWNGLALPIPSPVRARTTVKFLCVARGRGVYKLRIDRCIANCNLGKGGSAYYWEPTIESSSLGQWLHHTKDKTGVSQAGKRLKQEGYILKTEHYLSCRPQCSLSPSPSILQGHRIKSLKRTRLWKYGCLTNHWQGLIERKGGLSHRYPISFNQSWSEEIRVVPTWTDLNSISEITYSTPDTHRGKGHNNISLCCTCRAM